MLLPGGPGLHGVAGAQCAEQELSLSLPKSYSLPPAVADTAAAAAVESVYTEAVGRTFGWLERQCAYGMRGQPTASSPAGMIATGPNLLGAAPLE